MPDPKRKVLVTGGAGFIGSHVADAYLAQGDQVWIVDDLSSGRRQNVPEGATFVEADIADPDVAEIVRRERFALINHHAAQMDVRVSVADPARDARVNVLGLTNILQAACDAGTRRVVFVSSGGAVYGEPDTFPTPEAAPKHPMSPYGVTKLAGEYYLDYYRQVRGMEYVALRYGNVYGPRQDPRGEAGVVAIFAARLLDGEPLHVFGDGEQARDYVFVGDVVQANMTASEMPLSRAAGLDERAFNVGSGHAVSVNQLASVLEDATGIRTGRQYLPPRPGEVQRVTLAAKKFRAAGWSAATSLREGLRRTVAHIEATRPVASRPVGNAPVAVPDASVPTAAPPPAVPSS